MSSGTGPAECIVVLNDVPWMHSYKGSKAREEGGLATVAHQLSERHHRRPWHLAKRAVVTVYQRHQPSRTVLNVHEHRASACVQPRQESDAKKTLI